MTERQACLAPVTLEFFLNTNEKRQNFIHKVNKRSERARSASGTRTLDKLAEQHSKKAENTRAKRPSLEVSGRRKKDAFNLVGSSSYFHKSLNTLQSNFCESMRKIPQELRSGQPLAGHELFVGKKNRCLASPRAALVFPRPRLHYELALA